jgi:cytochrome d ubiquinol oxidase subunit II
VFWLRRTLVFTAAGMATVSAATPLASPRIFEKWFTLPEIVWLAPLPIAALGLFLWLWRMCVHLPGHEDEHSLKPFIVLSAIFALGFGGLAYSFYPYVVPDQMTIWEAAAATESLAVILIGTAFVLPIILGYTVYAYRVFGGKAGDLTYD